MVSELKVHPKALFILTPGYRDATGLNIAYIYCRQCNHVSLGAPNGCLSLITGFTPLGGAFETVGVFHVQDFARKDNSLDPDEMPWGIYDALLRDGATQGVNGKVLLYPWRLKPEKTRWIDPPHARSP